MTTEDESGTHRYKSYSVTVAKNGAIRIQRGGTISGYSAAIAGRGVIVDQYNICALAGIVGIGINGFMSFSDFSFGHIDTTVKKMGEKLLPWFGLFFWVQSSP